MVHFWNLISDHSQFHAFKFGPNLLFKLRIVLFTIPDQNALGISEKKIFGEQISFPQKLISV